jgi:hypothetical protein
LLLYCEGTVNVKKDRLPVFGSRSFCVCLFLAELAVNLGGKLRCPVRGNTVRKNGTDGQDVHKDFSPGPVLLRDREYHAGLDRRRKCGLVAAGIVDAGRSTDIDIHGRAHAITGSTARSNGRMEAV